MELHRGPVSNTTYGSWPLIWAGALAAKPHVRKAINNLTQGDISWGILGTPQGIAKAVISEASTSYEQPLVAQNVPRGGPEYAATVPIVGGTSGPSSRPALLEHRERIKRRYGVVEWLASSSLPPENR